MIRCTPTNGAPPFFPGGYDTYVVYDHEAGCWREHGLVADIAVPGQMVERFVRVKGGELPVLCRIEWIPKEDT
jgi:hypothetical protein